MNLHVAPHYLRMQYPSFYYHLRRIVLNFCPFTGFRFAQFYGTSVTTDNPERSLDMYISVCAYVVWVVNRVHGSCTYSKYTDALSSLLIETRIYFWVLVWMFVLSYVASWLQLQSWVKCVYAAAVWPSWRGEKPRKSRGVRCIGNTSVVAGRREVDGKFNTSNSIMTCLFHQPAWERLAEKYSCPVIINN